VVASSLESPDNGVQQYRLGPAGCLRRYSDSQLVVFFLCAMPLTTTLLLFYDLDSQLLAFLFSFRLLVRPMMTTKVVFLCGSTCTFLVCAGTWLGVLRCCRVSRPKPNPDSVSCLVSVCRPKTI